MGDRVPAEFIGKARSFRATMHSATTPVGPQMRAVCRHAFELYRRRNAAPRPDHLIAIEQQWRAIPGAGRLHFSVRRDRKSMLIRDTRVVTTVSSNSLWEGASEKSICLVESALELTKQRAETVATMFAAVSLHALARWYQRASMADDDALMRDLGSIIAFVPNLRAPAEQIEIESETGGCWHGLVVSTGDGKPVINVRTFIERGPRRLLPMAAYQRPEALVLP